MNVVIERGVLSQCVGNLRMVACENYTAAAQVNTIGQMQKVNEHRCYSLDKIPSVIPFKFDLEMGEKVTWTDYASLPCIAVVLDIQGRQPTITDASQIHFECYTLAYYK
jgi:hypothetical protein